MSFGRMQWIFPIAVTLHNTEEALFMPSWALHHKSQLPLHPSIMMIRMSLLVLTLAAFAITALSAKGGRQSLGSYLLFGYISAMLINVFVPHLPATILFRTYTPGVVTACLISLPAMSLLMRRALREQWVSAGRAAVFAALVPVGLAAAILVFFSAV